MHDATSGERATPYQADANLGPIKVRAVRVTLAGQTPSPAPSASPGSPPVVGASSIPPDTKAYVSVVFVNDGKAADVLIGGQIAGAPLTPTNASTSPTVDPNSTLNFVDPEITNGEGVGLAVTSTTAPLLPGTTVAVTFAFQTAGQVTVQAPVVAAPQPSS